MFVTKRINNRASKILKLVLPCQTDKIHQEGSLLGLQRQTSGLFRALYLGHYSRTQRPDRFYTFGKAT